MKLTFISKSRRLGSKLIFHVKGENNSSSTISTNKSSRPDSSVHKVQTVSVSNSCSTLTNDATDDDRRLVQVLSTANSVSTKVDHSPMAPKTQTSHSPSSSDSPPNIADSCQSALINDSVQTLDCGPSRPSSWSSEDSNLLTILLNQPSCNNNSLENVPFVDLEHSTSQDPKKFKGPSFRDSVTSTSKRLAQLYKQKKKQLKNFHVKLKQSVTLSSANSSGNTSTASISSINNSGPKPLPTTDPVNIISTNTQLLGSQSMKKSHLLLKNKRSFEEESFMSFQKSDDQEYKRMRLDCALELPFEAPCTPLQQILPKFKHVPSLEYLWADRSRRLRSSRSIESFVSATEVSAGIPRIALGRNFLSTTDENLFPPTPFRSPIFNPVGNNNDSFPYQDRSPATSSLTNSMHTMSMFTLMCQNSVSNTGTELRAVGDLGSPFHELENSP